MFAPAPRRRAFKPLVIVAAVVVVAALVPITFQYQKARVPPARARAWFMTELRNTTEPEALKRFGQPVVARDFDLKGGSIIGPRVGPKRFVPLDAADYEQRLREPGTVSMQYPQFTTVRQLVWRLPDSFLTVWFFQPRAEMDFQGDYADLRLPKSAPGVWAALDNYRVGLDLVSPQERARFQDPANGPRADFDGPGGSPGG